MVASPNDESVLLVLEGLFDESLVPLKRMYSLLLLTYARSCAVKYCLGNFVPAANGSKVIQGNSASGNYASSQCPRAKNGDAIVVGKCYKILFDGTKTFYPAVVESIDLSDGHAFVEWKKSSGEEFPEPDEKRRPVFGDFHAEVPLPPAGDVKSWFGKYPGGR